MKLLSRGKKDAFFDSAKKSRDHDPFLHREECYFSGDGLEGFEAYLRKGCLVDFSYSAIWDIYSHQGTKIIHFHRGQVSYLSVISIFTGYYYTLTAV